MLLCPLVRLYTDRCMAEWVKTRIKLHRIVGAVKDQLSTGKAIAKHGEMSQIDLAVLRATNHKEQAMDPEAVNSILEIGRSSRMRVSYCVGIIMERLNRTSRWVVALKCLILIHRCLLEGGFMYQDQFGACPAKGGYNYLNLSNFRDASSPFTWAVSAWIRGYARFIEQWIQTARTITYFPDITVDYKNARMQKICAGSDGQLVRDISALYDLLHEASSCQVDELVKRNELVTEGVRLIVAFILSGNEEIKLRLYEAQQRAATLEASQAVILLGVCDKLSSDSMVLTCLLEWINCELPQHEAIASEHVFLSDYDVMNLKQSFRRASTSNISHSSQHLGVNGRLALPWRSGSWNASNSESVDAVKFKARASLSMHKQQI